VAHAGHTSESSDLLGFLAGAGELPLWVGLFVGIGIAGVLGHAVGVYVGVAIGLLLSAVWLSVLFRIDRKRTICVCEGCSKQFAFNETRMRPQK
jgi:hypothetical protein